MDAALTPALAAEAWAGQRERESITFHEDAHFLFSVCESWILPAVFSLSLSLVSLLISLYLHKGL